MQSRQQEKGKKRNIKIAGRVQHGRIVPRAESSVDRGSVDQLEASATGAGKQS